MSISRKKLMVGLSASEIYPHKYNSLIYCCWPKREFFIFWSFPALYTLAFLSRTPTVREEVVQCVIDRSELCHLIVYKTQIEYSSKNLSYAKFSSELPEDVAYFSHQLRYDKINLRNQYTNNARNKQELLRSVFIKQIVPHIYFACRVELFPNCTYKPVVWNGSNKQNQDSCMHLLLGLAQCFDVLQTAA